MNATEFAAARTANFAAAALDFEGWVEIENFENPNESEFFYIAPAAADEDYADERALDLMLDRD